METERNVSDVMSMLRRHSQRERRKLVAKHLAFTEKYKRILAHSHRYLMGDVNRWNEHNPPSFVERLSYPGVNWEPLAAPEPEPPEPEAHAHQAGRHYLPAIAPKMGSVSPSPKAFRKGSEIFESPRPAFVRPLKASAS